MRSEAWCTSPRGSVGRTSPGANQRPPASLRPDLRGYPVIPAEAGSWQCVLDAGVPVVGSAGGTLAADRPAPVGHRCPARHPACWPRRAGRPGQQPRAGAVQFFTPDCCSPAGSHPAGVRGPAPSVVPVSADFARRRWQHRASSAHLGREAGAIWPAACPHPRPAAWQARKRPAGSGGSPTAPDPIRPLNGSVSGSPGHTRAILPRVARRPPGGLRRDPGR